MTKFKDEQNEIVLKRFKSHGFNFEINVLKSIWGVRNRPIFVNLDFDLEGITFRNSLEITECYLCGLLEESVYSPHSCTKKKPKVEIIYD